MSRLRKILFLICSSFESTDIYRLLCDNVISKSNILDLMQNES